MASYKSTNPLTIQIHGRDRLYFDLYEYCLAFRMDEMSCVREMEHDRIDRMIDHRNAWRQRSPNFGGSWARSQGQITEEQRVNCHAMLDFLQAQQNYKITVSGNWGYIYTNDLGLIRTVERLPYVHAVRVKRSVVDRPKGTLRIQNSQHEFRSYFRAQRLDAPQRHNLVDFLIKQQSIRLGPGLAQFVEQDQKHYYVSENFFIDHDGMGIVTMLALLLPRITRKTVKLIRDK